MNDIIKVNYDSGADSVYDAYGRDYLRGVRKS